MTRPLAILLLSALGVSAADWFVRPGGAGGATGADWANAWDANGIAWASIAAGDTIYLAGGTYANSLTFGASGATNNPLSVLRVRATDSAATNAAGWSAAFDAQVIFSGQSKSLIWNVAGKGCNVVVDGRLDSGLKTVVPDSDNSEGVSIRAAVTNVVLRHIEAAGPAGSSAYTYHGDPHGFYVGQTAVVGGIQNVEISHCRIHGVVDGLILQQSCNGSVHDCKLYDFYALNASTYHENVCIAIDANHTRFYANEVWNWDTEGIMFLSGAGERDWWIYNNLWHDPVASGTARIAEAQYAAQQVFCFNNTLVGVWIPFLTGNGGSWTTDSTSYNNLLWNVTSYGGMLSVDDYDCNGPVWEAHGVQTSTFPFVSASDFRLLAGGVCLGAGTNLSSLFTTDYAGNPRPSSGAWDQGAYQGSTWTLTLTGPWTLTGSGWRIGQ